jgi:hypothetical protein
MHGITLGHTFNSTLDSGMYIPLYATTTVYTPTYTQLYPILYKYLCLQVFLSKKYTANTAIVVYMCTVAACLVFVRLALLHN